MSDKDKQNFDELNRLSKLSSIHVDLKNLYDELNPFVEIAKHITGCSICEINILDAYYQWSIAGYGEDIKIMDRDDGICHNTIREDDFYEIKDLSSDERYKDEDPVKNDPKLRYYFGVPLTTQSGVNVGTICVMDSDFKVLAYQQKKQLKNIAGIIIRQLEMEGAIKKLQHQTEDLKEDFHKLNHDLRSPVNGIVGMLDLFIEEKDEVIIPKEKAISIKECATAIQEMVENVLENLVDEKEEVEKVSLEKIVPKLDSLYSLQADRKNISLDIQTSGLEETEVLDYYITTVVQIAGNLIANSIKFTKEGGTVEVGLSQEKTGEQKGINLIVSDNGKGMTNDQIISFNTGSEVDKNEGTAGEKSYGLGLEHVKSMVQELQGSIEVSSEEGKGATFRAWLPLD